MSTIKNFEDTSNSLGVIEFKVGRSRYRCEFDNWPSLWEIYEWRGGAWLFIAKTRIAGQATPSKLYDKILDLEDEEEHPCFYSASNEKDVLWRN
jgi:hypothetical protein